MITISEEGSQVKNYVLKGFTWVMGFVALMGACMLDSEDIRIPILMMLVGLAWCAIFYFVNVEYFERRL